MQLEGEVGEINVIEKLVELGRERFTGAVRFENDGIIKIIYFKGGDVLSASTNDRADSVDEILLRGGKVTREHVKQALEKRKETETLGDALLNLGFITRKELTWARRIQVIGVIRSIDGWAAGSYTIVSDYLPKREEGTLFPLSQMIVELIVTDPDREKIERALEGGMVVFDKAAGFDENFRRIGLNQDADEIAAHVNGVNSAGEIAAMSGKDEFNVYRLLYGFSMLGLITRSENLQAMPELSPGSDDSAGFAIDAQDSGSGLWDGTADFAASPEPGFGSPGAEPASDLPAVTSFAASEPVDRAAFDAPIPASAAVPNYDSPMWDDEPAAAEVPPPAPPRTPERQEQWGFDEAQIETARRAAVPMTAGEEIPPPMRDVVQRASKPNRWVGILLVSVALIALALAGFGGWSWWQSRQGSEATLEPVAVQPRQRRAKPPASIPVVTETTASGTSTILETTTVAPATATVPPTATTKSSIVATATTATAAVPPATSSTPRVDRAAGAPVITNTAAPPADPASAALRSRYDEMARTFAAQASGNYTVQFELVCQTASVTRALRDGGSGIWFVPVGYRGQTCYRVFWGRYATKDEAVRGMGQIPASLRAGNAPAVVRVPKP